MKREAEKSEIVSLKESARSLLLLKYVGIHKMRFFIGKQYQHIRIYWRKYF